MSDKIPFGFRQDREPEKTEDIPVQQEISVTACSTSMTWTRVILPPVNARA